MHSLRPTRSLLVILVLTFAVFAPSLANGFAMDDAPLAQSIDQDGNPDPVIGGWRSPFWYFGQRYWEGVPNNSILYRPVTVLSYDMWQDWFGGGSEVIGSELDLNGFSFVVVGVAPQSFRGLHSGQPVDLWIPSMMSAVGYRWCDTFSRGCTYLRVLGRLEPGATVEDYSGTR